MVNIHGYTVGTSPYHRAIRLWSVRVIRLWSVLAIRLWSVRAIRLLSVPDFG